MTVPPDPGSPDSGNKGPEPGDVTASEPSPWAAPGADPSAAYAEGPTAAYGQSPSAAYGEGTWAGYGHGSYGAAAGGTAPLFAGPAPVLVSFDPPASQSRLTIAFRAILVIPHGVVLWALGIATTVVVIIGWFAALFIGELPEWAHTFISGVLRWQARVYGYVFFLAGPYPPFSLEDERYPIHLATARTRLNRFAVLFRVILAIPAWVVLVLAGYGVIAVSFFVWLIALIAGRLPDSLHQALAAILRFQLRAYAYYYLVTPEYPWWGLFGDRPAIAEPTTPVEVDASALPIRTDPWQLRLSSAARTMVAGDLVIGLAAIIVVSIVGPSANSNPATAFSNAAGLIQIGAAYDKLTSSTVGFENATQACGGKLACVTSQDRKEAGYLQTFAGAVRSAGLQGQPATDASKLITDADRSAQSLDTLATATSVSQYESDFSTTGLQQQLNNVDSDYRKLIQDLASSG
jgi:Domain of unknown function (DUF4389)